MTLCIHQERIILIGINVGVVDCLVKKAERRVRAQVELNSHRLIGCIQCTKLFKYLDLADAAITTGISNKVEKYGNVLNITLMNMTGLNSSEIVNQALFKKFLVGSSITADASRFLGSGRQGSKNTQQEN